MQPTSEPITFPTEIKGERVILRIMNELDAMELKKVTDNSLDHLGVWFAWAREGAQGLEKHIEKIRDYKDRFQRSSDFCYGIFLKENDQMIGGASMHTRQGPGIIEIGYWLDKDFVKKGYAHESAKILKDEAFKIPSIEKVEIRCDERNQGSSNVAKALGMKHEYTHRLLMRNEDGERNRTMVWVIFREELQTAGN